MSTEVIDARSAPADPNTTLRANYPVGAFVYVRAQNVRATVIGHTEDGQVTILNGGSKTNVAPGDDLIVIALSAEDYAQRMATGAAELARNHGSESVVTPAVTRLLTEEPTPNNDLIHVVTRVTSHFTLRKRLTGSDADVVRRLNEGFYPGNSEFDRTWFGQVNGDETSGNATRQDVLVELEVVNELPARDAQ